MLRTLLIRLCVHRDDAEPLIGDLTHEASARVARGDSRASVWFWLMRETAAACAWGLADRMRRASYRAGSIGTECREAMRVLRRRPGTTLAMVTTLALGIGANTAMFTVLNAALWRPLPYANASQLVVVREYQRQKPDGSMGVSYLNFKDWRAAARSFSSMDIVATDSSALRVSDRPTRVEGAFVSATAFRTLGLDAAIGTTFERYGDLGLTPEGLMPVMLTDSGWTKYFQRDPAVVGKSAEIDGQRMQIVGVTPAGLVPLATEPIDFVTTLNNFGKPTDTASANGSRNFRQYPAVIARLASGVTLADAQRELEAINASLAIQFPKAMANRGVRVEPLRDVLVGDSAQPLWLLFGMVSVVLLVACVNVANVWLARAASRQREVSVRAALGASRFDIIRTFVVESVMVALAGGACGVLLSVWMISSLVSLLPDDVPHVAGLTPDWRVLMFALVTALTTGVLCGVMPAFAATRRGVSSSLLADGRRAASGPVPRRLRDTLIAVEVAAALVLLTAAGLMTNSLVRLVRVAPGFDLRNVLTTRISLDDDRYDGTSEHPVKINAMLDDLERRLRAVPGVADVAFAQSLPLTGVENSTQFSVIGRPAPDGVDSSAGLRFVSAGYFDTMRIPVKQGRGFTTQDGDVAPAVAMVNEAFVRAFLADGPVLNQTLKLGWGGDAPKQIVGVVGDVRHRGMGDAPRPEMYVPQSQFGNTSISVIVRATADSASVAPQITAAVHEADASLALTGVRTLDSYRAATLALPRFGAWLLGGFGVLALVLTMVGLYGVTSYTTTQRTQEIGVRMALGAQVNDVLGLVVRQGVRPVLVGIVIGAAGSMMTTGALRQWLYGVEPNDPVTMVLVVLLLAVVALAACYLPARRASRVDPLLALRGD